MTPEVQHLPDLSFPLRVVAEVTPSPVIHLGHYFGTLKNQIDLHHRHPGQSFFMVADYHALARGKRKEPNQLQKEVVALAATYLALGLDPSKAFLYRQSDVPELMEVSWILHCFTKHTLLAEGPALKELPMALSNSGLVNYPVFMAADILSLKGSVVPVSKDQLHAFDVVQRIASKMNELLLTKFFPVPTPALGKSPNEKGANSKPRWGSGNHFIPLFAKYHEWKTLILGIKTGTEHAAEPKDPTTCPVFHWFELVATSQQVAQMRAEYAAGTINYKEAKHQLLMAIQEAFGEPETRYSELMQRPDYVLDVLREGYSGVREEARITLEKLRHMVGIKNSVYHE